MMGWRMLLWAVLVVAAFGFLYLVRGVLLPFAVAFIISAVLDPSIRKLQKRGFSRIVAVAAVFLAFLLVVGLAGFLIGPKIVRQVGVLQKKVTQVTATIADVNTRSNFYVRWNPVVQAKQGSKLDTLDKILAEHRPTLERFGLPSTRRGLYQKFIEPRREQIVDGIQSGFNTMFGFLTNLLGQLFFVVLVPLLVFLMLMDFDTIKRTGPRWIPPSIRAHTLAVLSDIGNVFMSYLRGVTLMVLLYMVVSGLLLWVCNVPYAILLGMLFGVLYLIPYLGNAVSMLIMFLLLGFSKVQGPILLGDVVGSSWTWAVIATLLFLVMGTAFDNLIYPRVVGRSVGLNPTVSLFVILCGGALFGFVGMLIAFPLAGSVKIILDRLIAVTNSSRTDALSLPPVPLRHRTGN